MKEFISTNNIRMVEGELFNWKKESPFELAISIGNLGKMYVFSYDIEKKILSLFEMDYSSDYVNNFSCELLDAEKIVISFAKANKFEIMPLYAHTEIESKEPFLS